MPYVSRDENNQIIAIFSEPQTENQEFLENDNIEILEFISQDNKDEKQLFLSKSDIELIRVLEDLVDLLTEKHVILFTDLPVAAQNKLLQRKSVRKSMQHSLIDTDEENIF